HISAYGLTIEPRTFFGHQQKKGELTEMEQERSGEQFLLMLDEMDAHGFEQYEVSNFCKPEFESKHNSSYWRGSHYIGYGPSAHSFDGKSRQWNVSNNSVYIKELTAGKLPFEHEELSQSMRLNEYIMTGLRTKWGIEMQRISREFSFDFKKEYADMISELQHDGRLIFMNETLMLTRKGLLMADKIASDFFVTD
ncbi:MAG: coproporphyrinogen III oxidase, partial [Flavobacteriales bacterium]